MTTKQKPTGPQAVAVLGDDLFGVAVGLGAGCYPDLAALVRAIGAGEVPAPVTVVVCAGQGDGAGDGGPAVAARVVTGRVLGLVQGFLAEDVLAGARLVVVTRGAVAAEPGEGVADLAGAAVWGLVRSAQSENPGRFVLADLPAVGAVDGGVLGGALGKGEPEVVVRDGGVLGRRLTRPASGLLIPPSGGVSWRLDAGGEGALDGLGLVACPEAAGSLGAGQVRVAVRAAGVNFRDVLIGLGMYPGRAVLGGEVAGVVLETGPGVTGLVAGDRVLGLADGGFGPVVVTDARLLVPVPDGWSFAVAAGVPVAFMTAWYGLADLAGVRAGQRLLVHAATGGVGMAAVGIARHLGLEVFATASPGKHGVLRAMGFDEAHIASSRDGGFEAAFLAATGGAGVDVVLNALAGELTDASLRLLPRGGMFMEMGKTDVRDPAVVAADHPGVTYRAFDLADPGPDELGVILGRVAGLLAAGVLAGPRVRCWDVRRAPEAFRFMSQARHTGKIVLTIPPDPAARREPGTVLVTGGTGTLGGVVAGHLAGSGQARELLLVSRSGPAAAGAAGLAAGLAGAGAGVRVAACDAADRGALAGVLDRSGPLSGVVHAAGVTDDGVVGSLTAGRVDGVMRAKADAAWNVHVLTAGMDLESFVMFSSAAAAFGSAGQGNYAAANAFLDALAAYRQGQGLAGQSLGWGLWGQASALSGHADVGRIARDGMAALPVQDGLGLLDLAAGRDEAYLVPARLDVAGVRAAAGRGEDVPALWRTLAGPSARSRAAAGAGADGGESLRGRLAGLAGPERDRVLLDLVRVHAAAVLGHASPAEVEAGRVFSELGFDSLTAVELRNRLGAVTGLRLPATLVFDYPSPVLLAGFLRTGLVPDEAGTEGAVAVAAGVALGAGADVVVVVGVGCRFPGGVAGAAGLWDVVVSGRDVVGGFPVDRGWDGGAGGGFARVGGFVEGAAEFDAGFFGISPREAVAVDPQQRLLLEVAWEALEDAGIVPGLLRGSRTGVFAGAWASGYGGLLAGGGAGGAEGFVMTGTTTSVVSGRVAYVLGLEGPAVTVDTACSSSLVAVHLAGQALRGGECDLALAGGVTVMATPDIFAEFAVQGGLAGDGRCKAFSAGADGTGWGEGAGVLVLERLSDARRLGHRVLAVVAGSAVNQDGASNGLTAPNGPSQQRVIRAALASAGVGPGDVDVVEGHGTGTRLGDPIEAQALIATYGQDRVRPLLLGSVKSNIGHAQAAAGVAGVIKMVQAMRHGVVPPTLHADVRSEQVDWAAGAVELVTQAVPWPAAEGRPRAAGVSSFGISGTNAHLILQEAPPADGAADGAGVDGAAGGAAGGGVLGGGVRAWVVSGRSGDGLAGQAGRLAGWVAGRPGLDAGDVGWSLAVTREVFGHRAVVTGSSGEELAAGLAAIAAGQPHPGVVTGTAGSSRRVVLVFPGQGAQWIGMGRELAASSPVFGRRLAECGRALAPFVDWSLEEVIAGTDDALATESAAVVQPVLWAVMVSLAAVWEAAGVTPDAVVGHSQGEIAAACVAGILSLEDAAKVVALRSRALGVLAGQGGMMSVAESAELVRGRLASWGNRVSIAVVNGPTATVVSGEVAALTGLAAECEAAGIRVKMLPVNYASHSSQVEAIRDDVLAVLTGITPGSARIPMISAATGDWLAGPELDAGYWYTSLRSPVEFGRAVRTLAGDGCGVFIEVSPHPVLTGAILETLEDAEGVAAPMAVGTLRRDDGGPDRFLQSLAEAHVGGVAVDWAALGGAGQRVELPTYAFRRDRYWPRPTRAAGDMASAGLGAAGHPLLGAVVELAGGDGLVLTGQLSLGSHPWLADHVVGAKVLVPGTAFVEMAVRAGDEAGCPAIEELTLEAPLVLRGDAAVQVQVVVGGRDSDGHRPAEVYSRPAAGEGSWTRHASGLLAPAAQDEGLDAAGELTVWPPAGAAEVDLTGFYERLAAGGREYGPAFRGLRAAWRRGDVVFAEVALPGDTADDLAGDAAGFGLHPALLDAALHAADAGGPQPDGVQVPFEWRGISLAAAGASAVRVQITAAGHGGGVRLVLADQAGALVAVVGSLVVRELPAGALDAAGGGLGDALFSTDWTPVPLTGSEPAGPQAVVVVGDDLFGVAAGLGAGVWPDASVLAAAVAAGEVPAPVTVLICAGLGDGDGGPAVVARVVTGRVLGLVQGFLAEGVLAGARLVVVTRGAVAAEPGEGVADLAGASVWGLVRSAESENPGRLVLADLSAVGAVDGAVLGSALGTGEPELAVRGRAVYGRRLGRPSGALVPPSGGEPWRLDSSGEGTLDGLALVACPEAAGPLAAGQVRVAVRAAGVNFRDVLIGLGMYPGRAVLGGEVAGIVLETGPGVTGLAVGNRVLGLADGGFGPVTVTDHRLLVPVPDGWSSTAAAAVPVAFMTAWYGLADLAGVRAGQRLLVHAATGGVGMAAVGIARHLGLEVFATASPGKHGVLRAMGFDDAHIASSRDDSFEAALLAATGGAGVDVVLNALAGELTDASLRLLPRGGMFIEMGKTDVRDPAVVAADHPGVTYRAFDLADAGPDRLGQILARISGLVTGGELGSLPVRCWDVRRAGEAFRFMSQARHTGKIVLTIPPDPAARREPGTVLVTGGTGTLGGVVAGHLAGSGQARELLLVSRSGPAAAGAAGLAAGLAGAGAGVQVAACDAADRGALAGVLDRSGPLTRVVHAAGAIDDGVIGSLTAARVDGVMRSKADAAWNVHVLTAGMDLESFVMFSSSAAAFGSPGQGNYAAANAFLDGLAQQRRTAGLPAVSLGWGLWARTSAMTGHADLGRIARDGMTALTADDGIGLLDLVAGRDEAVLVPARLDVTGMRARAGRGEEVPALWRVLAGVSGRSRAAAGAGGDAGGSLRGQLAGLPAGDQDRMLLDLVRVHAAAVLGHASPAEVEPRRAFSDLGFDSLTAVELRNRLNAATGLRLPATLVFDYPSAVLISGYLRTELVPAVPVSSPLVEELDKLESLLAGVTPDDSMHEMVIARLQACLSKLGSAAAISKSEIVAQKIESASDDEMFEFINRELGRA